MARLATGFSRRGRAQVVPHEVAASGSLPSASAESGAFLYAKVTGRFLHGRLDALQLARRDGIVLAWGVGLQFRAGRWPTLETRP